VESWERVPLVSASFIAGSWCAGCHASPHREGKEGTWRRGWLSACEEPVYTLASLPAGKILVLLLDTPVGLAFYVERSLHEVLVVRTVEGVLEHSPGPVISLASVNLYTSYLYTRLPLRR